jgi:RNA polymerase sigma factor (sigma-70 family)
VLRKLPKLKEIIAGVADQKNASKEVMYKTYYGYLMAVTMRYINNRSDSEELVNDTFIKIFNHITQFQLLESAIDPEKTFRGWMAKIASRNCIDYLRKRRAINEEFDDIGEDKHPQIYSRALDQLYVEDILKLLNTLPESQRIIFNMFEIEGFSHDEISKSLGIPENICRVYLGRAKQKLRKLYNESLIVEDGTYG